MLSLQPLKSDVGFIPKQSSSIRTSHVASLGGLHTSTRVGGTALEVSSLFFFHLKKISGAGTVESLFLPGLHRIFC